MSKGKGSESTKRKSMMLHTPRVLKSAKNSQKSSKDDQHSKTPKQNTKSTDSPCTPESIIKSTSSNKANKVLTHSKKKSMCEINNASSNLLAPAGHK